MGTTGTKDSPTRGWTKKSGGAAYAGVGVRTFHEWLRKRLRHVKLPSGTVLTRYDWIDDFLKRFEVGAGRDPVDELVTEIMDEMGHN